MVKRLKDGAPQEQINWQRVSGANVPERPVRRAPFRFREQDEEDSSASSIDPWKELLERGSLHEVLASVRRVSGLNEDAPPWPPAEPQRPEKPGRPREAEARPAKARPAEVRPATTRRAEQPPASPPEASPRPRFSPLRQHPPEAARPEPPRPRVVEQAPDRSGAPRPHDGDATSRPTPTVAIRSLEPTRTPSPPPPSRPPERGAAGVAARAAEHRDSAPPASPSGVAEAPKSTRSDAAHHQPRPAGQSPSAGAADAGQRRLGPGRPEAAASSRGGPPAGTDGPPQAPPVAPFPQARPVPPARDPAESGGPKAGARAPGRPQPLPPDRADRVDEPPPDGAPTSEAEIGLDFVPRRFGRPAIGKARRHSRALAVIAILLVAIGAGVSFAVTGDEWPLSWRQLAGRFGAEVIQLASAPLPAPAQEDEAAGATSSEATVAALEEEPGTPIPAQRPTTEPGAAEVQPAAGDAADLRNVADLAPLFLGRVFVHYAGADDDSAGRERAERVARALEADGYRISAVRPVNFAIRASSVRYFFDRDREAAARLRDDLPESVADGARVMDFTSYEPRPRPGTIELWLAGPS